MRLVIRVLGRELLAVETGEQPQPEPGLLPNGAPDIEVTRHSGEFSLGFGPPAPPIAPRPAWSPTEDY